MSDIDIKGDSIDDMNAVRRIREEKDKEGAPLDMSEQDIADSDDALDEMAKEMRRQK